MLIRTVAFDSEDRILVLHSQARMPTTLIRWDHVPHKRAWQKSQTSQIYEKAATGMRQTNNHLIILASDGNALLTNLDTFKTSKPKKLGSMPLTCATFYGGHAVTGSADYCYNFVELTAFSSIDVKQLALHLGLVLILIMLTPYCNSFLDLVIKLLAAITGKAPPCAEGMLNSST